MIILESALVITSSFTVKQKALGLTIEYLHSTPEHPHGDEIRYKLNIDDCTLTFGLLTLGDRRLLKNFVLEQNIKFRNKNWWQFWIKNDLANLAQDLVQNEKAIQKLIIEKLEKTGDALFTLSRMD